MPNNEGLEEQYYIPKLRLRIGTAVEQKFICELPDRQVRKQRASYMGFLV